MFAELVQITDLGYNDHLMFKKTALSLLLGKSLLILSFLLTSMPVSADFSQNIFGIHVTQIEDLPKAAELVNSNGGDWGYITVVIPDNDQNIDKWQSFFDTCRSLHLIPLVRIATHTEGAGWVKPKPQDLKTWANFLDLLNWPTQTRFVLIYNEPNHNKEWGGDSNPREYAGILNQAITDFKEKNKNFFLLNAGLDQASPNGPETMDEITFLKEMDSEVPGIFNRLDGWNSHSYPNLGFIGKPWEKGKATIYGYDWELNFLKNNLGLNKNLPVIISETGWPHRLNAKYQLPNTGYYDLNTTADFTQQAFQNVWLNDNRVMAITPFILNYPAPPFLEFSWLDQNGSPSSDFKIVAGLPKLKGNPFQEEKFEVVNLRLPFFLPANFLFEGKITLRNTGQSIWGEKPFRIKSASSVFKVSDLILPGKVKVKPGETWTFSYFLETPQLTGSYEFGWEELPKQKLSVFHLFNTNQQSNPFVGSIFKTLLQIFY